MCIYMIYIQFTLEPQGLNCAGPFTHEFFFNKYIRKNFVDLQQLEKNIFLPPAYFIFCI